MACYVSSGPLCLNIDMGKAAGLARVLYIIYKESKNKSHKDVSFAKFIFLILINVFANQCPLVAKLKYSLYIPFAIFAAFSSPRPHAGLMPPSLRIFPLLAFEKHLH